MDHAYRRSAWLAGMLAIFLVLGIRHATAGPPLVVDDPETLDRGHFEWFTSVLFAKFGSAHSYDTPTQLTIGLAKGWECSISGAYQYHTNVPASPDPVNGVLSLEVGTKFRLLTESSDVPLSLALAGKLRFPTAPNAKYADQGKASGGGTIVISKAFGDFTLNGNVGYGIGGSQNRDLVGDAWFLGVCAQQIFAKKYTLFAEVYAMPPVGHLRETVINADGGLLWDLSERYRITVLLGRGFRPGGADFVANLGFLLSLGRTPTPLNRPGK